MKKFNYIYLIRNIINNKIYIGKHSTDNLDDGYMGSGKLIKRAIKKEGVENFTKEILSYTDTPKTLNFLEKFYIKKYKARNNDIGYNLTYGGDGGSWNKGLHLKLETKNKISIAHIGKKRGSMSDETKHKLSIINKGKIISEETRLKMSLAHKGKKQKPFTDEHRKHISEFAKQRTGEKSGMFGKHHSEETKQKMRKPHNVIKHKWLTPNGEIKITTQNIVTRFHNDWIIIS